MKLERAGDGVEVLRVRPPARVQKLTNIYLLAGDGDGVVVYETGSVGAAGAIREAAAERGGIGQIVLSHAHADHRGGASKLGAPVFCHADERPGAEGDGWAAEFDYSKVRNPLIRAIAPRALRDMDGGPLEIAGTLAQGDTVAGFQVLHLPGHTPGQIGLWGECGCRRLRSGPTIRRPGRASARSPRSIPQPSGSATTGRSRAMWGRSWSARRRGTNAANQPAASPRSPPSLSSILWSPSV